MLKIPNHSLRPHNTFGIETNCRLFVSIGSVEEAQSLLPTIAAEAEDSPNANKPPYIIIGGGSNLLLTDDYPGTVLHSSIKGIKIQTLNDYALLRAGSGEEWDKVVEFAVENNLYGAENLSIIPGHVGASAVQNIGAYGVEIKDIIHSIEAVNIKTGQLRVFKPEECNYAYRQSIFKNQLARQYFITHVTYRLSLQFNPHLDYGNIRQALTLQGIEQPTASQLRQTIIQIRQSKLPDPSILGNAGSFFMNPILERSQFLELQALYPQMPHYTVDGEHEKIPAAWLIEQCGWKGRSLGPAAVHSRQALVLVNKGGARGADIIRLCQAIQRDVEQRFGIKISPEVNIL